MAIDPEIFKKDIEEQTRLYARLFTKAPWRGLDRPVTDFTATTTASFVLHGKELKILTEEHLRHITAAHIKLLGQHIQSQLGLSYLEIPAQDLQKIEVTDEKYDQMAQQTTIQIGMQKGEDGLPQAHVTLTANAKLTQMALENLREKSANTGQSRGV